VWIRFGCGLDSRIYGTPFRFPVWKPTSYLQFLMKQCQSYATAMYKQIPHIIVSKAYIQDQIVKFVTDCSLVTSYNFNKLISLMHVVFQTHLHPVTWYYQECWCYQNELMVATLNKHHTLQNIYYLEKHNGCPYKFISILHHIFWIT
jgi:hypothetical protein